jgi:hypothetical protein
VAGQFYSRDFFKQGFWADGFWANTISQLVIDTHDGFDDTKEKVERYRKAQKELREELESALNDVVGIAIPENVEEVQAAIPAAFTENDIQKVTNEVKLLVSQIYMQLAIQRAAAQDEDDVETLMLLL